MAKAKRIGIYAGTFNPVHVGHVSFALQALEAAQLDAVYFLPERRPRHKQGVEHFAHRVAMLKAAVRPHPQLRVMETDDISFTVQRTLPKLYRRFAGAELVMLFGSDVVPHMAQWLLIERLCKRTELVVGLRDGYLKEQALSAIIADWPTPPRELYFVRSHAPDVSSHKIRQALEARTHVKGLLRSVAQYSNRNWLYVSLSKVILDKA